MKKKKERKGRKMKKVWLVTLIMIFALTGCKKEEEEFVFEYVDDGSAADTIISENSNVKNDGTAGSYVDVQYTNEGTYEIPNEGGNYSAEFNYVIPKITDNSDEANAINKEIIEPVNSSIELITSIMDGTAEEIYEPEFYEINYEAYLNGEILSLVVEYDRTYSDSAEYNVYNYNVSTHSLVKNSELLESLGISKSDFTAKAKKTFGAMALPDIDEYMTTEGDVLVEDSAEETDVAEAEDAEPADDEVTLDTDSDENAEESADYSMEYSMLAEYVSDYGRTVCEKNINTDMQMYLDADGELNVIGLVHVPAGGGQYYAVAKLSDAANDAMLKKYCEYVEKYRTEGFEKQLFGLYGEEGYQGSIVRKITASAMASEEAYIGFDSSNPSVFTMQFYGSDYSNVYTGTISFDSMDENGIVYKYVLDTKNGEVLTEDGEEAPHTGRFYISQFYYTNKDGEFTQGATYKFLDGEDMMGSDGYNVDLTLSFG